MNQTSLHRATGVRVAATMAQRTGRAHRAQNQLLTVRSLVGGFRLSVHGATERSGLNQTHPRSSRSSGAPCRVSTLPFHTLPPSSGSAAGAERRQQWDEHTDRTTLLQQSSVPDPPPSEPRRSIGDVSDVTIHGRTPAGGERSGSRFQGALRVDDNRALS